MRLTRSFNISQAINRTVSLQPLNMLESTFLTTCSNLVSEAMIDNIISDDWLINTDTPSFLFWMFMQDTIDRIKSKYWTLIKSINEDGTIFSYYLPPSNAAGWKVTIDNTLNKDLYDGSLRCRLYVYYEIMQEAVQDNRFPFCCDSLVPHSQRMIDYYSDIMNSDTTPILRSEDGDPTARHLSTKYEGTHYRINQYIQRSSFFDFTYEKNLSQLMDVGVKSIKKNDADEYFTIEDSAYLLINGKKVEAGRYVFLCHGIGRLQAYTTHIEGNGIVVGLELPLAIFPQGSWDEVIIPILDGLAVSESGRWNEKSVLFFKSLWNEDTRESQLQSIYKNVMYWDWQVLQYLEPITYRITDKFNNGLLLDRLPLNNPTTVELLLIEVIGIPALIREIMIENLKFDSRRSAFVLLEGGLYLQVNRSGKQYYSDGRSGGILDIYSESGVKLPLFTTIELDTIHSRYSEW